MQQWGVILLSKFFYEIGPHFTRIQAPFAKDLRGILIKRPVIYWIKKKIHIVLSSLKCLQKGLYIKNPLYKIKPIMSNINN